MVVAIVLKNLTINCFELLIFLFIKLFKLFFKVLTVVLKEANTIYYFMKIRFPYSNYRLPEKEKSNDCCFIITTFRRNNIYFLLFMFKKVVVRIEELFMTKK